MAFKADLLNALSKSAFFDRPPISVPDHLKHNSFLKNRPCLYLLET